MYAIVSAVEIAMDAPLKAFTLSRIFCASDLSSISRRPVPSTSQTPACAMFQRPVASDPLNPRPRKRGTAIMALWAGGAPVASCTAARSAHAMPNAVPAVPRLARSSASMFVSETLASSLSAACSSSVVVTLEASTVFFEDSPLDAFDAAAGVELLEHVREGIVEGTALVHGRSRHDAFSPRYPVVRRTRADRPRGSRGRGTRGNARHHPQ